MSAYDLAIVQARKMYESAKGKLTKKNASEASFMQNATRTALGTASAFGAGYADGRYPTKGVFGMPLSFVIGAGATALAYSGYAGKAGIYVSSVGDGSLAAYAAMKGVEKGKKDAIANPPAA